MDWRVAFHPAFLSEFEAFSEPVQDEIAALIKLLGVLGPQLKRPRSDTLKGSAHANMKELRFDADGGVWRLAYAFDPERKAILLVAGDKSGVSSKQFYKILIKRADERFDEHVAALKTFEEEMSKEYRTIPAEKVLARFPRERQARINARALELLAEEIGLGDLRKAKGVTQEQLAKKLGSRQVQISRLEKRSDIKMSTLEKYFEALGARIEVLAFFQDSGPFRLARLGTTRASAGARRRTPIKKVRRARKAAKRTA